MASRFLTEADKNELAKRIPTKTSELSNDSGYVTDDAIPIKTSQLTNDSKYQNESQVKASIADALKDIEVNVDADLSDYALKKDIPTKTSQLANDSKYQNEDQVKASIAEALKDINVDIDVNLDDYALKEELDRLSEEIADVQNGLGLTSTVSPNIINPEAMTMGHMTKVGQTINIIEADYFVTSDYIAVKAGQVVVASPRVRFVSGFDSDKNYASNTWLGTATTEPYTFTATQDGYVRFTFWTADKYHAEYDKAEDYYEYGSTVPMKIDGTFIKKKSVPNDALIESYALDRLKGKTILNFGDSIAAGDGNNGISYADIIASNYNMTLYDYARGGATITNVKEDNTIQIQITNAITDHVLDNIDYILLEGGTNDVANQSVGALLDGYDVDNADVSTLAGALETAFYNLRNTWALSKIIYVIVHKMHTRDYNKQVAYHDTIVSACKKWSIPYVDIFEEGEINSYIQSIAETCFNENESALTGIDRTHPNATGYTNFYVPMIYNKMNGV